MLAVFTALATAVVVGLVYVQGSTLLVADATRRLDGDARGVVDRIQHRIADRSRAVTLLPVLDAAQDVAVDDIDKRLSEALTSVAASLGGGDVAVALDTVSHVVASSDPALIGGAQPAPSWAGDAICREASPAGEPVLVTDGGAARMVVSAPIRSRTDGHRLGCIALAVDWETLVREAAPPGARDAIMVNPGATATPGGSHTPIGTDATLSGHAASEPGVPFPVDAEVMETRQTALAPVRAARQDALALALAIMRVTLPAAAVVALGATRALRALARSALEVDASTRPVLTDPGSGAPVEVRVLHEALGTMLDRQEESRHALAEREVLASLGTMAAAIAHEIRTPLAVMHGSAQMLELGDQEESRRRELTQLITQETGRLDRLVGTLLTFARPRPPELVETDLAAVCRRALPTLEGLGSQHGVLIETRLESAPTRLDPEQVLQVVLNLTANAVQVSPRGGVVRVTTFRENGRSVLEIADRGPGISSDDLAQIWTPFFTTRHQGTGLGLAIVRRIVDAHDGRIHVTTAPGAGTTMRVELAAIEDDRA